MGARPDIFEDLRSVGALKRDRLDRQPSDNALGKHAEVQVSRDTVGAWLRGDRFPQQVDPLLAVLAQIRAEADCRGLLDTLVDSVAGCTVSELLDPGRWRRAWEDEQQGRVQANKEAAYRQRAQTALEDNERRARQAALADRPRPVRSWSARRLGVHPAIPGYPQEAAASGFVLPRYVPRPHDTQLRTHLAIAAADGASPQLVVVRGESCTGKTRTAFEAVRAAVPGDFELLFPVDADGLLAVLAADALGVRTVLWLNEAQDYLDGPKGEAVAAALLRRLDAPGPLIMVATLWPDHDHSLTRRPASGLEDQHNKARELLLQAHYTRLPDSFADHLDAVRKAARHDQSLATATKVDAANLTQTLAAGPDLVTHYEHPAGKHSAYGAALISAAMDAYRLGATGPLPLAFLEAAAPGYLSDTERAVAGPDWFIGALAYARTLIKQTTQSLQEVPRSTGMGAEPGVVRLADFLQQHGRRTRHSYCPPAAFWNAATSHILTPTDLAGLAHAAESRSRFRYAARLYCASVDAGNSFALADLASMRARAGETEEAERLYRTAAEAGSNYAQMHLGRLREEAGDWEEADQFYRQSVETGNAFTLMILAGMREEAGDRGEAELLYLKAAEIGNSFILMVQAEMRDKAGDREKAERLYQQAAEAGNSNALMNLMGMRLQVGDLEGAERLYWQAVEAGNGYALVSLAGRRPGI